MALARAGLGAVIGVMVGLALVFVGDYLNHMVFPPPPEVQATNPEAIRAWMAKAPVLSLIGLPVTWTIAAFAAAFAGAKIGASVWAGWIAGALIFAGTCLNLAMIPHPLWMSIAVIVLVPLAAWLGGRLADAKRAST